MLHFNTVSKLMDYMCIYTYVHTLFILPQSYDGAMYNISLSVDSSNIVILYVCILVTCVYNCGLTALIECLGYSSKLRKTSTSSD